MNERVVDVMPTISVAIEYGQHLDSFDVDIEGIVEYLRERGLNDMQIQNLELEFSGGDGKLSDHIPKAYGVFYPNEDKIVMYSLEDMVSASRVGHESFDEIVLGKQNNTMIHELEHKIDSHNLKYQVDGSYYASKVWLKRKLKELFWFASGTSAGYSGGEITGVNDFLAEHNVFGMPPWQMLGAAVIGAATYYATKRAGWHGDPFDEYWNDPSEQRARAAADLRRHNFISFAPKYIRHLTTEKIDFAMIKLQEMRDMIEKNPELAIDFDL